MTLELCGRKLATEPARAGAAGIILLAGGEQSLAELRAALDASKNPPSCRLAALDEVDWDADYSPWPLLSGGRNFSGGADALLPALSALAERLRAEGARGVYLVGYSMGGLAALYLHTKLSLDGCASCSGSLWYPDLCEYLEKNPPRGDVYLSLGGKEKNTRDELMKSVEERTLAVSRLCEKSAARTVFVHEPGGHFRDTAGRMARGVAWLLK